MRACFQFTLSPVAIIRVKKKKVLLFFYLCQIEDVDVTNVPRQVADNLLEFADKWARLHVRMPKGLDEVSFSTRIDMQSELPKSSNQSINTLVDYSVS